MHPNFLRIVQEDSQEVASIDLPWSELNGQRIVVTGAAGFLGGGVVRALLALNASGRLRQPITVIAVVRHQDRASKILADVAADPHLQWLEWDFNRMGRPDLGGPDSVIHAASQASPKFFSTDPVGTILPNTLGTAALLEACGEARRFVFISSSEVYGTHTSCTALSETDFGPLDPTNIRACYAESKRSGEALCMAWQSQYGLQTSIVRPFHTYGPGLKADDGRVFSDFAFALAQGNPIVMTSSGSARRAFCYASDATAGLLTVLLKGEPGQAYNLGNSKENFSILELARLLCEDFRDRGARLDYRPPSADYLASTTNHIVPDVSRLLALGWTPKVGVSEGFQRFIEAITP